LVQADLHTRIKVLARPANHSIPLQDMLQQWGICLFVSVALAILSRCDGNKLTRYYIMEMHKKMDYDNDGYVGHDEMKDFVRMMKTYETSKQDHDAIVATYDANKDGKIDMPEFHGHMDMQKIPEDMSEDAIQFMKTSLIARFRASDPNGDGILEGDELRLFFAPKQHDSVVTAMVEAAMSTQDRTHDGLLQIDEMFPAPTPEDEEEFKHADMDKDGGLNMQELEIFHIRSSKDERFMHVFFNEADTDNDKRLTLSELEKEYDRVHPAEHVQHFAAWKERLDL